jgi:arylsulfatase A-like enzyme
VNVLLITTDQHRADTLGVSGNPVCQTPHLDRLAAQGAYFPAARTQNPFCQPARATILTGTMPSTHGVTFNGRDLPARWTEQALSTTFARAGYRTGFFGKAHFATTFPTLPTGQPESVEGSAAMDPDWSGPYFGFDDVQLILFGHNLRMAPLMGNWSWCFGPPPFGLHYARFLYRDGRKKGDERLAAMQPEASGARWDETQTWRSAIDEEHHPTTWTADVAIDWLKERARNWGTSGASAEPFFGWVSFADPHHPMDPPGRWFDMYEPADVAEVLPARVAGELDGKPGVQRVWSQGMKGTMFEWANPGGANLSEEQLACMIAAYYGMISQLDHNIGRILTTLDELGLADDTMVLMSTDHGELLGDHQIVFKGPIHYDGLLRVPLIVRAPGVSPGTVVSDPVGTIDLGPTMLQAAGVATPSHHQGAPLFDATGNPARREWALTEDDFDVARSIPLRTISTDRYKLTAYLDQPDVGELYDLQEDPGELVNRWDDPAYAGLRRDLAATLADLTVRVDPADALPALGLVA